MRLLRPFSVFLIFVVIAGLLLSWFLPASQKVERTVTIHGNAQEVFQAISSLNNLKSWLTWAKGDSNVVYSLSGPDGKPGASLRWEGDPRASGEGMVILTASEPYSLVSHDFKFLSPRKRSAHSDLSLKENNGLTTVTWTFTMNTPRPWNIANLFYSMDKEMGKDFEDGLALLKVMIEKSNGAAMENKPGYTVERFDFPATSFALIRQEVKWSDLSSFFQHHYPILYEATAAAGISPGGASSLIYSWNEKDQVADIAAAIPVPAGTKLDNPLISLVDIPASKALLVNYKGPYDHEDEAYNALREYIRANNLKQTGASIEQYITGPSNEADSTRWLTKIIFLVE